jgi:hypothetical protein
MELETTFTIPEIFDEQVERELLTPLTVGRRKPAKMISIVGAEYGIPEGWPKAIFSKKWGFWYPATIEWDGDIVTYENSNGQCCNIVFYSGPAVE